MPCRPNLSIGLAHLSALDEAAIVATTNIRGEIVYVNDKFCNISGYPREELIGANHRILKSSQHDHDYFRDMYRTIAHGRCWRGELCNRRKDGSLYWVDTTIVPRRDAMGKLAYYDAIRFDITPLKIAETSLWREANTDFLTGLWNRSYFTRALAARVSETSYDFSLALMDLDGFKDINDVYGHNAGDDVLKEVAQRLAGAFAGGGTIARLGGDEFAVISAPGCDYARFSRLIFDGLSFIRQPFLVNGDYQLLSASFGLARFPIDGNSGTELLKNADIALYAAKAAGKDQLAAFTEVMAKSRRIEPRRHQPLVV